MLCGNTVYSAEFYCAVLYFTVLCCILLWCTVLICIYCARMYFTVLCCSLLRCALFLLVWAVFDCALLYNTLSTVFDFMWLIILCFAVLCYACIVSLKIKYGCWTYKHWLIDWLKLACEEYLANGATPSSLPKSLGMLVNATRLRKAPRGGGHGNMYNVQTQAVFLTKVLPLT